MIWEIAGTMADILAAVSAATAAIFTYFTVKAAMDTNKLAAEQSELNREYQEKSSRPSLDIRKASFNTDLKGDFLGDWMDDTEQYKPSYASNLSFFLENLGNVPARNIRYSVGIENIEEIKKFIEENAEDIERRTGIKINFQKADSPEGTYNVTFSRDFNGKRQTPTFKATHYVEEIGYLKSYQSTETFNDGKIFIPKLFIYFINILKDQVLSDHLVPQLKIKLNFSDPYSTFYYQEFKVKPVIRNMDILLPVKFLGSFELKEIANEKLEE